jgi:hypothetical protein
MGVGDMALQLAEVVCAVAIDTGDWDAALGVIDEMRDRPQAPAHRIQFACTEAMLRALRGDSRAGVLLDGLEPLDPAPDPHNRAGIEQARAWIAFVDGRLEDARRLAEAAGSMSLGAERHAAIMLAARAGLWLGDGAYAASWIALLGQKSMHGRAAEAAELTLRAGAAALDGQGTAEAMYDEATASWRSLRLPLHLAMCLAERQRFVVPVPGVDQGAGEEEAEAILAGLGATGLLRALRPVASSKASASRRA